MIRFVTLFGLLTLGLFQGGCVFSPVADDTFIFCPAEFEVSARRELHMGYVLELSEQELLAILDHHFIEYQEVRSEWFEYCGDEFDPDVRTVYQIHSRTGSGGWSAGWITISQDGKVKHIIGEFWVTAA